MDTFVLVLLTFDITISVAGLAYMVWGIRKIIEITRAGDDAIFPQGLRMEEVWREMREELRRA